MRKKILSTTAVIALAVSASAQTDAPAQNINLNDLGVQPYEYIAVDPPAPAPAQTPYQVFEKSVQDAQQNNNEGFGIGWSQENKAPMIQYTHPTEPAKVVPK